MYTRDQLERMDTEDLDRMAFGFASGDTLRVPVSAMVPTDDDIENAVYKAERYPGGPKAWARSVDFSEPVELKLKGGRYLIRDGHHRYYAATLLKRKTLQAVVEIDDSAIDAILAKKRNPERGPAPARRFPVRTCPQADAEHRESVRQYCHVFHNPGVICVARAFHRLPRNRKLALLLHEVGHLLAGPRGGEDAANRAAQQYSGVPIYYTDAGSLGPELEWIKPGDAARASQALGLDSSMRRNPPSDPWARFGDLQKQGFMKSGTGKARPRSKITGYRVIIQGGGTIKTTTKADAMEFARAYGGKVEPIRE